MSKISELESAVSIQGDTLFVIVNDPNGAAVTLKISASDLFGNVEVPATFVDLHLVDSTPLTSSDAVTKGKIWFDADFIYVAVDEDEIKRVALTSF